MYAIDMWTNRARSSGLSTDAPGEAGSRQALSANATPQITKQNALHSAEELRRWLQHARGSADDLPRQMLRRVNRHNPGQRDGKSVKKTRPTVTRKQRKWMKARKERNLTPQVRRIPRQIVTGKWDVLPQAAQEQVRELLKAIEQPVLMSYRNHRRREEAQSILGSVLRKLTTKIPRMPFPSQAKDVHFNYEMLLDANRTLEANLTPAMHSINLLTAEIDREELLLQADETKLSDLMGNAKAAESSRKLKARQLHPLLKVTKAAGTEDDADSIGLVDVGLVKAVRLDVWTKIPQYHCMLLIVDMKFQPDEALAPLVKQLDGHLKSLGENTAQIKVLGDALAGTKAMVDDALYKCLGTWQYEKIISI
ncbi:hypothetical protein FGG08_001092 [Glutinoglossum americanum]|uniref:Uncharacterized protein n=1 Tax=Glutinoglossum americanum TaxID=1670608 RepID=A0A9P8ICA6_9PEZI|nr:hypothetical protein FGG08_001092 [Glutinoglossum americanum]